MCGKYIYIYVYFETLAFYTCVLCTGTYVFASIVLRLRLWQPRLYIYFLYYTEALTLYNVLCVDSLSIESLYITLPLSRSDWDFRLNSLLGGNDTSKAKYLLLLYYPYAMETDSTQVPSGKDEKHPSSKVVIFVFYTYIYYWRSRGSEKRVKSPTHYIYVRYFLHTKKRDLYFSLRSTSWLMYHGYTALLHFLLHIFCSVTICSYIWVSTLLVSILLLI